ncbi:sensor domain-containing diguanylate cyclase [Chitinilyticum litopenaei]|uniref:sensor domain-containing diguanylate cyclase n=1 Tax=Chitinilyticum litopenaei TaxID=1121276 RepID=UPI000404EEA3|nr:diguanylate cyclase [Chitinilyticum litopenaei]
MNWTRRPPWIITALALLFCAGVVLILGLQVNQSFRNAQNHALAATRTQSAILESRISSTMAQINLLLTDVGNRIGSAELSGAPLPEEQHKALQGLLLDKLTLVRQISNIALIAPDGQLSHEALDSADTHIALSVDDVATLRNNRYLARQFLVQRPESRSVPASLLVINRIEDDNGDFAGLLVASLSSAYFQQLFASSELGEQAVIELIDGQGRTIASLGGRTHDSASMPFSPNAEILATLATQGEAETITEFAYHPDGTRIISYRAIAGTPLRLLVSAASPDYLRSWKNAATAYLAGGIILLGMALLMSFFFWRSHRLTRSLRNKELKLQASENRFRQVIETTPVALMLARLPDHFVTYINQQAAQLFDLPQAAALSMRAFDFFQDRVQFLDLVYYAQQGEPAHNVEIVLKRHDGLPLWATLSISVVTISDQPVVVIGVNDITERKRLEEELKRRATTDGLSGLANRAHFMERSEAELQRARRYRHPLSLMMLDIDFFKQINDSFGHAAGDQVIQAIATVARSCLRDTDLIARMGGEEFAILLPETGLPHTMDAAERLRSAIESHVVATSEGHRIRFTTSVGVAELGFADESISDLLKRADKALYQAKHQGRNQVCVDTGEEPPGE